MRRQANVRALCVQIRPRRGRKRQAAGSQLAPTSRKYRRIKDLVGSPQQVELNLKVEAASSKLHWLAKAATSNLQLQSSSCS